jgi:SAM-dependent methyltransferase
VTGVDNDAAMLDRARASWARASSPGATDRRGSLTLVEHDLTTLSLATRFDFVILALNSLLLLDGRAAQERALNVMRAHLAPTGRAVIDVWLPDQADLELYDGRQVLDWVRTDPETEERVAKTTLARYDAVTNTADLTTTYDIERDGTPPRTTTHHDLITFIGADGLFELARKAGLQPETVLGDYSGTTWSNASERVVLIARAGSPNARVVAA